MRGTIERGVTTMIIKKEGAPLSSKFSMCQYKCMCVNYDMCVFVVSLQWLKTFCLYLISVMTAQREACVALDTQKWTHDHNRLL